ncbi:MAG: hypothetical protein IJP93_01380 [Bacteroidales bacterium]|nr:hypothetical protein [Bacteroidales bacterium]
MVPASLSAGFAQTRVSIDGVSPKWTSGDRIAVFTTDGTLCPAFSTEDSGKTRASVSGNLLKGVLTSTTRPSGTCRVLSAESTDALAAFGDFTGSTVAANTAYLAR